MAVNTAFAAILQDRGLTPSFSGWGVRDPRIDLVAAKAHLLL
jgi:hypothetical protein